MTYYLSVNNNYLNYILVYYRLYGGNNMKKKIIMISTIPLGSNNKSMDRENKYDEYYRDEYHKLKLSSIYGECKSHNDHTSKDKKTKRASKTGLALYQLIFFKNILDQLG